MQMSNESKLIIDEEAYYDVIRMKTAKTFAFCAAGGAISADAEPKAEEHLYKFGEYLGMIFQIKDDIFDYFDSKLIGKPTSNDLKEGKMTLPLIYALNNSDKKEARPYLNMIRNKDFSQKNLSSINLFVKNAGGVKYAEKRMEDYLKLALEELSGFPESPYKQSLILCVDYFMLRKY
jgi:octaprenyl-diphosphate synthase